MALVACAPGSRCCRARPAGSRADDVGDRHVQRHGVPVPPLHAGVVSAGPRGAAAGHGPRLPDHGRAGDESSPSSTSSPSARASLCSTPRSTSSAAPSPARPIMLEVPLPAGLFPGQQRHGRDRGHDARRDGRRGPSTPSASTSSASRPAGSWPRSRRPPTPTCSRRWDSSPPRAYADGPCFTTGVGIPVEDERPARVRADGAARPRRPALRDRLDGDLAFPAACSDKALEQGLRTNNLVLSGRQDGPIALTPAAVRRRAEARRLHLHGQQLPRSRRLPDRRALDHPRHAPRLAGRDHRPEVRGLHRHQGARAAPRARGRSSSATASPTPGCRARRPRVAYAPATCPARKVTVTLRPRRARAPRAGAGGRASGARKAPRAPGHAQAPRGPEGRGARPAPRAAPGPLARAGRTSQVRALLSYAEGPPGAFSSRAINKPGRSSTRLSSQRWAANTVW